MPYPPSLNDRAWELFLTLVAAKFSIPPSEKAQGFASAGFDETPALRNLAVQAYAGAEAFEEVYIARNPPQVREERHGLA